MKDPAVSQTELAKMCGRSLSWVTKRMSLVGALTPRVVDLVARKQLPPATAQEIARLPRTVQHRFAIRVVEEKVPKSVVERLVALYNAADASEEARRQILVSPASALSKLEKEAKQPAHAKPAGHDEHPRLEKWHRMLGRLLDKLLDLLVKAECPVEIMAAMEAQVRNFLHKLQECQQRFPRGKEETV